MTHNQKPDVEDFLKRISRQVTSHLWNHMPQLKLSPVRGDQLRRCLQIWKYHFHEAVVAIHNILEPQIKKGQFGTGAVNRNRIFMLSLWRGSIRPFGLYGFNNKQYFLCVHSVFCYRLIFFLKTVTIIKQFLNREEINFKPKPLILITWSSCENKFKPHFWINKQWTEETKSWTQEV